MNIEPKRLSGERLAQFQIGADSEMDDLLRHIAALELENAFLKSKECEAAWCDRWKLICEERNDLQTKLTASKKLYELTLSNEMDWMKKWETVKAELTTALAAIGVKDEALRCIANGNRDNGGCLRCGGIMGHAPGCVVKNALSTTPPEALELMNDKDFIQQLRLTVPTPPHAITYDRGVQILNQVQDYVHKSRVIDAAQKGHD